MSLINNVTYQEEGCKNSDENGMLSHEDERHLLVKSLNSENRGNVTNVFSKKKKESEEEKMIYSCNQKVGDHITVKS